MMDDFTVKIQNKKIKLETALSELNNEILASFNFLQRLKNHSAEIVRDLNSVTTPAIYFKGFVDVNSFILKYLSFLTEINCKFEMLRISENGDINSLSVSDSTATSKILSGAIDNSDSQLDSCKSLPNFLNKEDRNEQPIESSASLMNVKSLTVNCEVESSKKSSSNNSQNKSEDFKNNLHADSENLDDSSINTSSNVETDNLKLRTPKINLNISKNPNGEKSDSEVSPQINCIAQIDKGKPQAMNEPGTELTYSDYTSTYNEVQQQIRSHVPTTDIPVAEVIPTKVAEYNCNPEILKGFKSKRETNDANLKFFIERRVEENSDEDDIKPISISGKVGDEYEIMIEHIQSPSEFYVSIKDGQSNVFVELLQNLKFICGMKRKVLNKKNENRKAWLSEQLGSYVLYYSKYDEVWCRAKVINWCLNYQDDFIKIFLVDYGEYKCVSIDDLEAMPEYFKKYPTCTRRCHLYGICPSDIDIDIDTLSWGKESTEKMKSLTEISKKLKIKIAPKDDFHPEMSLPVTLWLVDQNNECVNELLVRSKCAVYCFDSKLELKDEISTENEVLKHWNPMKEDFEAYENSYELNIDDPATYIYGYVGKDYEKVCKHFAKTGHCFKGKACKKEHKKLDPLGFTTDQEEIYKSAFNSLYVPPPNSVVRVLVTCLLGINTFCCILDDGKLTPEEENLQTLLKFMNTPENIQQMKKLLIPPSAGQIVIAQYNQDQAWYRAKILESQPENDVYTILFVDYGNKETVSLSEIKGIEARYLHLPFQAMRCYIFGIDRNPEVPVEDAMNYLNERVKKGHISIEIVSKLPGETVTLLVHLFDQNGMNIGADLISNNYAVRKEEMIISSESESMPG